MKRKTIAFIVIALMIIFIFSCIEAFVIKKTPEKADEVPADRIVIGFSQLGAESDWRSANTESMKNTFSIRNGYELIFEDGQQKQSNQITAIRTFIQQGVDYIVLAPVTETGWETVLWEAKDAEIPVIIVDRMVNVSDEKLFSCWVGSNFEMEGRKAAEWLKKFAEANEIAPGDLHIVNIQGTIGASAQIGRTKGLADAAASYGWDLMAEVPGEFTQAKGREVMEELLKQYDNINVVYCENDNEAFGAIEAIEAAGKTAGSDIKEGEIMVISFDGVNEQALEYVKQDKITCIVECNPLHGPRVEVLIDLLEEGKQPDKLSYVDGAIYCSGDWVNWISVEGKVYEVTVLTATETE